MFIKNLCILFLVLSAASPVMSQSCRLVFSKDAFKHPLDFTNERYGLLNVNVPLNTKTLLAAYSEGVFPWFDRGEFVDWYSPASRGVLILDKFRVNRSNLKTLKKFNYHTTDNVDFQRVIRMAATVPRNEPGLWLNEKFIQAYIKLHELGVAKSVEVWSGDELVGGLYGVLYKGAYFGESMFSLKPSASKFALVHLVNDLKQKGIEFIDTQQLSEVIESFGGEEVPRIDFMRMLKKAQNLNSN